MKSSFPPRHFLELADKLLNDKKYDKEARIRTSIGRAYYAAFLSAMRKLESFGFSFTNVDRIHREVIEALKTKDGGLGSKLDDLFEFRVQADYFMDAMVTNFGDKCCRFSEHIINRLEDLKKEK
jgi:uncharacterized protein (UPF0332 family)